MFLQHGPLLDKKSGAGMTLSTTASCSTLSLDSGTEIKHRERLVVVVLLLANTGFVAVNLLERVALSFEDRLLARKSPRRSSASRETYPGRLDCSLI